METICICWKGDWDSVGYGDLWKPSLVVSLEIEKDSCGESGEAMCDVGFLAQIEVKTFVFSLDLLMK